MKIRVCVVLVAIIIEVTSPVNSGVMLTNNPAEQLRVLNQVQ